MVLGIVGRAHEATGLGDFSISTRHMRQLPGEGYGEGWEEGSGQGSGLGSEHGSGSGSGSG